MRAILILRGVKEAAKTYYRNCLHQVTPMPNPPGDQHVIVEKLLTNPSGFIPAFKPAWKEYKASFRLSLSSKEETEGDQGPKEGGANSFKDSLDKARQELENQAEESRGLLNKNIDHVADSIPDIQNFISEWGATLNLSIRHFLEGYRASHAETLKSLEGKDSSAGWEDLFGSATGGASEFIHQATAGTQEQQRRGDTVNSVEETTPKKSDFTGEPSSKKQEGR